MNSEPLVRDVMRTQYLTISPDATLREAVEILYVPNDAGRDPGDPQAQSLLVQDAGGILVGMLTMFDIIEGIEPQYMQLENTFLAGITWEGLFEEAIERAEKRTVKEVMTPRKDFEVLSGSDRIMKALELMVADKAPRLPVCEEGTIVGVVRLYDVFQEAARRMLAAKGKD